jgi:hypothetical protein
MAQRKPAEHADKTSPGGEYAERYGIDLYRDQYERGWKAANSLSESRVWESGMSSDAFDDGYLDAAAGREKWHMTRCANHDTVENGGCGHC